LAFLGLAVGIAFGILVALYVTIRSTRPNKHNSDEVWNPEIRLPMSLVGCVAIPVGLFWFAWTNDPSLHWLISVAAQVPFGFGFVLVYISIQNYLVDAYTIYSASVLAANAMLRSIFGATFPLFTSVRCRIHYRLPLKPLVHRTRRSLTQRASRVWMRAVHVP